MIPNEQAKNEKEEYVRHSIIEQGYNKEKFIAHLDSKKSNNPYYIENGSSINNWDIDELKGVHLYIIVGSNKL